MASDPICKIHQMLAEAKARMTPERLKKFEAFELLSWDEQMAIMRQPIPPPPEQQEVPQPTTSSKKKLRNEKTRQQYKRRTLQQANAEQNAENTPEKATSCNTSTVNTSQLSIAPHQAIKQSDRDSASYFSNSSKIHGWNSFRLCLLAKPCHYTMLASPLASLPGYMEYAEEMEATGQG